MVEVILYDSGYKIDTLDGVVSYNIKSSDIGDITKLNCSYSPSMKFPKTPRNTYLFQGLGLIGDQSDVPYRKVYVDVVDDGLTIVAKGLISVTETTDEYKVHIQDGIIDFIKDVGNDKVSEVIDLSDLSHYNTVANIVASWTNTEYRYIIANYNGPPLANNMGITDLNPIALVPSINILYLWNKIFEHYGWTYQMSIDLSDRWMTYPNGISYDNATDIQILNAPPKERTYSTVNDNDLHFMEAQVLAIDGTFLINDPALNGFRWIITQAGNYKVELNIKGIWKRNFPHETSPFAADIMINGVDSGYFNTTDVDEVTTYQFIADAGTTVYIRLRNLTNIGGTMFVYPDGLFKIKTLGVQEIDFSEALIKMKVKDFFKEVMTRFSLTAFPNVEKKEIEFLTLTERVGADYVDWTEKYVERQKEQYVYNSYAQNNFLRHKYNDNDDDYADGNLFVENENLDVEKDLYKSPTYAPLEELIVYNGTTFPSYYVNNFKMFDIEVKEDANTGDLIATYKPLKDRFYIMQAETRNDDIYILGQLQNSFPIAVTTGNVFRDIIPLYYGDFEQVLSNSRIHDIELALSKYDVPGLDLKKIYFFEQEESYYLLNSLKWKPDSTCVGEFIRLKK